MYKNRKQRRREAQNKVQHTIQDNFFLPFQGELDPENRWVVLAKQIPWDFIEEKYKKIFCENNGAPAKSARLAFGCLFIKEKCNFTDEETVAHIKENPYMQMFIGLDHFERGRIVEPSLFVAFRKRLEGVLAEVNELICTQDREKCTGNHDKDDNNPGGDMGSGDQSHDGDNHQPGALENEAENSTVESSATVRHEGALILDATCAPADIAYPTDARLLNESREKLEEIIDQCYQVAKERGILQAKPRTYREVARIQYLNIVRQRNPSSKKIRKAIRQQLNHVARDLQHVAYLIGVVLEDMACLTSKQQKDLMVIHEVYRQQKEMYEQKTHHAEDRIVSISQPYVRPIVRGKARAKTEFGAKIALSLVDGYVHIDRISWDNFNEGITLEESVTAYQQRYGCLPKVIIADQIYRNRDNFRFCKTHHIRLSGPRLGRKTEAVLAQEKKQIREEMRIRNQIEGKIGEGKRCYGWDLIMSKLQATSVAEIIMQAIVMNLKKRLSLFLCKIRKLAYSVNYASEKTLFSSFYPAIIGVKKWAF